MNLSQDERALYAELVVQIAIRMGDIVFDRKPPEHSAPANRFDIKDRILEHGSIGDFEAGCQLLQTLKVVQPVKTDERPLTDETECAEWFRVKFDLPGLREHMRRPLPDTAPALSDVIKTFLGLTTDYGCEVSVWREAFAIPPDFEPTFDLFERCGYVERADGMVTWTEKIAPVMRELDAWYEDGSCREDSAEIAKMWHTMPTNIRTALFRCGPVEVSAIARAIAKFWYYGAWHRTALDKADRKITLRRGAFGKARALAKQSREPKSGSKEGFRLLLSGQAS
jgi:hypothetical protein